MRKSEIFYQNPTLDSHQSLINYNNGFLVKKPCIKVRYLARPFNFNQTGRRQPPSNSLYANKHHLQLYTQNPNHKNRRDNR